MPAETIFMVRAVVDPSLRARFDHWYETDHLPWAARVLEATKASRYWSDNDPPLHFALYECASKARLLEILRSDTFKALLTDFDKNWPSGVSRTREILQRA